MKEGRSHREFIFPELIGTATAKGIKQLKFLALALSQSKSKDYGLTVVYIIEHFDTTSRQ